MKLSLIYNLLVEGNKVIEKLKNQNQSTLPKIRVEKVFFHGVPEMSFYHEVTKEAQPHIGTDAFKDEKVDVKMIVPTQRNLNINNIEDVFDSDKPTELVKDGQFYYVIDGHHRIASKILKGKGKIIAKVYTNNDSF